MALRVLIIHEFRVARKITHGYILAELGDAVVDMISSSPEALDAFDKVKYDVVLSGLEMKDMDGLDLQDRMRISRLNRDTPMIVMTASYDKANSERLRGRGVKYILPIPFSAVQLRSMMGEAVDPRSHRQSRRYGIPNAKAIVRVDGADVSVDVVNISKAGILCTFAFPVRPVNLLYPSNISIQFPVDYDGLVTGWIASRLLRLAVESWNNGGTPKQMLGAWEFTGLSFKDRELLERVLEKAHDDLMYSGN